MEMEENLRITPSLNNERGCNEWRSSVGPSSARVAKINQVDKVRNVDRWKRYNYLLGTIRPSWPVPSQKTKSFFKGIEI